MARIIGGIAASHTPTIGFAYDRNKRDDPVWAPIFENFAPLAAWLADKRPDVLLMIYNDHVTSFFFDHYSAFALGVAAWAVADEGGGARDLPPIDGHPQLASHIGHSLMADEFDMAFFQHRALDHGCFSPLSVLCPHEPQWPVRISPCRWACSSSRFPPRVASTSSGRRFGVPSKLSRRPAGRDRRHRGLSHQVHGERAGFNNPAGTSAFSISSNAIPSSSPQ
jgi:gallate dioxygenase